MEDFSIDELKNIVDTHKNINELWKVFLEKNECSPELSETIDKAVFINTKLIVDANKELEKRRGEIK